MIPSFRVKSGPDPVSREATKLRKGSASSISFSRAVVCVFERMRSTQGPNSISLSRCSLCAMSKPAPPAPASHSTRPRQRRWLGSDSFLKASNSAVRLPQILCRAPRHDRRIGRDGVDDADRAARHQHAIGLCGEALHVVEVMRGEAADDEIEARVGEGKVLGLGVQRPDIGEASARRKLPRLAQASPR